MNTQKDNLQKQIWRALTTSSGDAKLSIFTDTIIYGTIILNSILIALNSYQEFSQDPVFQSYYYDITLISIFILTIEYFLKLWSCPTKDPYVSPFIHRLKFVTSVSSIVQLIVIFSVVIFGVQANLIFILLIRTLKLSEYFGEEDAYSPIEILKKTFINKKEELFITILFSIGIVFLSSFLMFYFESSAQPEKFNNIGPSIGWVFSVLTSIDLVDFTPITLVGKILHVLIILMGILIVGLPVGILTGSFIEEIRESKKKETLRKRSQILIKAFHQEQSLVIRKLVKSLHLASERRNLDIDFAMARLEFSQSEIFEASRFSKLLRIRACKQNIDSSYADNLVLESYPANKSFGTHIERDSRIHVISTQSVGDVSIGHYSRVFAEALNANYYSNEFFSSANLREEMQFNFAVNKLYNEDKIKEAPIAFQEWVEVLQDSIQKNDLVIYFGVSDANREHFYHILFGGKKGDEGFSTVENPTIKDIDSVEKFYKQLESGVNEFDMPITTHSIYGNTNKNHLTQVLKNKYSANVLTIFVNKKVLEFSTLSSYYKTIRILADAVESTLKEKSE